MGRAKKRNGVYIGLFPGDAILEVNGAPVEKVVESSVSPSENSWYINYGMFNKLHNII